MAAPKRHIESRHFLRRRARKAERTLERERLGSWAAGTDRFSYRVEKATRGPYRWLVVRLDRGR